MELPFQVQPPITLFMNFEFSHLHELQTKVPLEIV